MRWIGFAVGLGLSGCTALNPSYGETGEGSEGADSGASGSTVGGSASATSPGVGEAGAAESTGSGSGPGGATGTGVEPPRCGDGALDPGEVCDDGRNDGSYGGCEAGCDAKAAFCGDGLLDVRNGEECDDANDDAADGCLQACLVPTSCLDILIHEPGALDGDYRIVPEDYFGPSFGVYCDMVTDGGGYTFSWNESQQGVTAAEAEMVCAARGMQLWIPRSDAHLSAAWAYAVMLGQPARFLRIFGVYPAIPEGACSNMPFNSGNPGCQWRAGDDGPYWVHGSEDFSEPSGDNPVDQSAIYDWGRDGELSYLDDLINSDIATAFFCDVGDKWR